MTTLTAKKTFTFEVTGSTGRYCKESLLAGEVLIQALARKGREYITLSELYDTLGAEFNTERNGIQFAVEWAKRENLIRNTNERGVYAVV